MPDLLTTDEAAAYLRLSERKLYELVANGDGLQFRSWECPAPVWHPRRTAARKPT